MGKPKVPKDDKQPGPGKGTGVHDDQPPAKVPGKSTYVVGGPGSDYVNHGTRCQAGDGDECFLDDGQRGRMIQEFADRVGSAKTNYQVALTLIALDKLTEKPPEMPIWATLFLSALGLGAGAIIGKAMEEMVAQGAESLEKSVAQVALSYAHGKSPTTSMSTGAAAYTQLTALASSGKLPKAVTKSFSAVSTSVADAHAATLNQKQLEQVYLLQLQDDGSRAFTHVREDQIAKADDAELIALWRSFEDRWHSVTMYKELLSDKLERFKKSAVMTVGREAGDGQGYGIDGHLPSDVRNDGVAGQPHGGSPYTYGGGTMRDRFVVRLVFESGATSVLAYADKYIPSQTVYDVNRDEVDKYGGANSKTQHDENVAADPPRHGDYRGHPIQYVLNNYNIIALVEEEFAEVAVEKQKRYWGALPTTIWIRDRYAVGRGNTAAYAKAPNNPMLAADYTVTNKTVNWSDPKSWGMRDNSTPL